MANFADTAAGRVAAEDLVKTRMTAKTWIEGHMGVTKDGNTCVRFIRPLTSALTQGAWVESRDDAAT
jgi:hypothetical protein